MMCNMYSKIQPLNSYVSGPAYTLYIKTEMPQEAKEDMKLLWFHI